VFLSKSKRNERNKALILYAKLFSSFRRTSPYLNTIIFLFLFPRALYIQLGKTRELIKMILLKQNINKQNNNTSVNKTIIK
jgi:hypothetical protein